MKKQIQSGKDAINEIKDAHRSYIIAKRKAEAEKKRLQQMINRFPKRERPLYEEELTKRMPV